MCKPNFERCTIEATKLLYLQNVSDRILDIQKLTYDKNIIFDSIQNYCQITRSPLTDFLSEERQMLKDGCTIYRPECDYYIVLYNAEIRYFEHLNWTLAHEVGHIYLGHTGDGDLEEIEAHYFAAQLLMPDFSINMIAHQYGKVTVEDIMEIFGVSEEAATKRIGTMNRRTCISFPKRAQEIWNAQKEKVDLYYECKKDGMDFRNSLAFWLETKADYEREARLEMYAQAYY